jgi:hypothetical protein
MTERMPISSAQIVNPLLYMSRKNRWLLAATLISNVLLAWLAITLLFANNNSPNTATPVNSQSHNVLGPRLTEVIIVFPDSSGNLLSNFASSLKSWLLHPPCQRDSVPIRSFQSNVRLTLAMSSLIPPDHQRTIKDAVDALPSWIIGCFANVQVEMHENANGFSHALFERKFSDPSVDTALLMSPLTRAIQPNWLNLLSQYCGQLSKLQEPIWIAGSPERGMPPIPSAVPAWSRAVRIANFPGIYNFGSASFADFYQHFVQSHRPAHNSTDLADFGAEIYDYLVDWQSNDAIFRHILPNLRFTDLLGAYRRKQKVSAALLAAEHPMMLLVECAEII